MEDFSKNLIKQYKYWDVFVAQNQSYLGRCVVWCKRENALDLTDATEEEREELFYILKSLKDTVYNVFKSDWFNYSFLGNLVRHLHCHFVPRYAAERVFEGMTFRDELYGKNWKTDNDFIIPEESLMKIKGLLIDELK
jgi:diadenosine tetraphosphate (Ap4A) HIT family hydrolase